MDIGMPEKQRIAVVFGGRSPEHDISIVTGLQVLEAVDSDRYEAFAVYVTHKGEWLVGEPLANRSNYLPDFGLQQHLTSVILDVMPSGKGVLLPRERQLFRRPQPVVFDVALLAFHGTTGEDGQIQGLFETAAIPYTGMRTLASSVLMDKAATKRMLRGMNLPMLSEVLLTRPKQGLVIGRDVLATLAKQASFPAVVKPNHLGSSIGVAKVNDVEELAAVLPQIFRLDAAAILEPFVSNLVEYNISVCRFGGRLRCSAIEKPKNTAVLLDFKQKYLSGGSKAAAKTPGQSSQGMLSLTREINPSLPPELGKNIRAWAEEAFLAVGGTGAPRLDFMGNSVTGEIWLNEVNPCPGSFGYFLWEAAEEPMLFTQLITNLIDEAVEQHGMMRLPNDPVPDDARLFKRP
jgi:D-alanine-D-alanine ligase